MTTVVLDTNALMMPVECDVRVFEELDRLVGEADLIVPRAVVAELETLSAGGGTEGRAASVGRDLVDRCRVVETEAGYADDAVVELAEGGGDDSTPSVDGDRVDWETVDDTGVTHVVTNDRELQGRLPRDVHVIGIRGANTLAETEP
ncbi:MAG: PIN domain-containing protein [Halobaculum sp.]|jgi:rRNA-processing protein FCF1